MLLQNAKSCNGMPAFTFRKCVLSVRGLYKCTFFAIMCGVNKELIYMNVEKQTNYGTISVSEEAVASLAGGVITECYGVVGMASKQVLRDGWAELLNKENYAKGVIVRNSDEGLEIDLYIIVGFGIKISEIVAEAQKKVKYVLEKTLSVDLSAVNVFVQGVRVTDGEE